MDVEEEVRANWAALAALRGDLDTARDHADAEELRRSDDGQIVILVACLDALIAYADERPEQAIAHARRMLDFVNVGLSYEHLMLSWSVMARSAYEIGDLSTVADLVGRLAAQAPGHVPPLLRAELALHRTWLLAADGGDDEAVTRGYADAITQLRAFGSPYHLGHALVDEARHLRAMGRSDEADAAIAEAEASPSASALDRSRVGPRPHRRLAPSGSRACCRRHRPCDSGMPSLHKIRYATAARITSVAARVHDPRAIRPPIVELVEPEEVGDRARCVGGQAGRAGRG